jgi:Phage tail protein
MSFIARGGGGAVASTPTTATITATLDGGGVLWVVIGSRGTTPVPVPTVTSPGATFTLARSQARPEDDRRVSVFWSNDYDAQTNMILTIVHSAAPSAVAWAAAEQTGATTTADPVAQSSGVAHVSSATPSTTLAAGTGEMLVAAVWSGGTTPFATPGGSGVELFDLIAATTGIAGYWNATTVTNPSMTMAGAVSTGFIALETVTASAPPIEPPVEPPVIEPPSGPHPWEALPGCETHTFTNPLGESVTFLTLKGTTGRFMPPMVVTTVPSPAQHGSRYLASFHAERAVALPVAAPAIFDGRDELRRWARVLDPAKGEGTLTVVQGEWAGRSLRCVYEAGLDELEETSGDFVNPATFLFRAAWPYWNDASEASETVTQDDTVRVWFPFPPLIFMASTAFAIITLTNDGDVDAWPTITGIGPGEDITVSNLTTGQSWTLEGVVDAGSELRVDHRPGFREVSVDGVNSFERLTPSSTLWPLVPGPNQIEIEVFNTTVATSLTFTWRRLWLAA